MYKKFRKKYILLILLFVFVACSRTQPIYNVQQAPIPNIQTTNLSLDKIGVIIADVASNEGWVVENVAQNKLTCTMRWRQHIAVIEITYSEYNYNINYISSQELHQENGKIHRNYNKRILKLENEINKKLSQPYNVS